jgi:hypothetical protein
VYGEGGLEEMLGDFYGIQNLGRKKGEWRKMYGCVILMEEG